MATLLPPIHEMIVTRHQIRAQRLAEVMLTPRVLPAPLPTGATHTFCRRCKQQKPRNIRCHVCYPPPPEKPRLSQRDTRPAGSPGRREAGLKRGATALGISVEEYRQRREAGEKWCNHHKRWETRDGFVLSRTSPDGRGSACVEGMREYRDAR